MDYAHNLSENIKLLIEQYGLSIKRLAQQIGIPASTLTDGLKSKKGLPIETAIAISDYFGYDVTTLSKKTSEELLPLLNENSAQKKEDTSLMPSDLDIDLLHRITKMDVKEKKLLRVVLDAIVDTDTE